MADRSIILCVSPLLILGSFTACDINREEGDPKYKIAVRNLGSLSSAMYRFANERQGDWPTSWNNLASADKGMNLALFKSPYDDSQAIGSISDIDNWCSYGYVPGHSFAFGSKRLIIAYDIFSYNHTGAIIVLYSDGEVELLMGNNAVGEFASELNRSIVVIGSGEILESDAVKRRRLSLGIKLDFEK